MALYETILICRQDISSAQVESLTETFSNILKEQGGSVVKTEQWGLKTLTYRIKKNRKGHYVYLGLDAPAAAVAEMERNMSINEDVLRYMTVKVEKIEEGQTAMLANKGERAERGPRGGFGDRGPRREFGDRGDRGDRPGRGPRRDAAVEGEGDRA
ncbi:MULTISPECIES: 30S ribosomal protein S6 [Azospirillaceae]|jgi:small subunit ribosomal protein S6|uniref:30S ribosomal protein S6 n=1 Tax=Azospirillaceae TaxID=2829815 RepID=UPI000B6E31F7|nr:MULTISPECIES: 30S ribosomal protein S6 [Azospirillaceae]MDG5495038.1 30S ribosomal protein S6 [Niveispirillum sp. BGYR6]SNR93552.1 small subunit ribosomal protein S6 [Azospirillum sp. RU38E]SNS09523.1 small subunit ribosomal protein S6 [Azospirillum sp. RU37A]